MHDGLYRLKTYDGGTLSGGSISGTPKREQDFTLDQLGNWSTFKERDTDTGSTWDLDQDRAHNDVNEIDNGSDNGITTTTGTDWTDPVHDAAGNMTTIPQPKSPSSSYTLKYDAWNRLVEIKDGATVKQANEFDGLNRRIVRDETGGSGVVTHFYYNRQWQVLVEADSNDDPICMYAYHSHYVDAPGTRIDADGIKYYLHDANFNVTAVTDDAGTVKERYSYTPYGEVTVLYPNFSADADNKSDIDNEYLYTGRRLDPETGLQLNRNRFYASHLGRWVNRDPLDYLFYDVDINVYAYVFNDPLTLLDPSGLQAAGGVPPWDRPGRQDVPRSDFDKWMKCCLKKPLPAGEIDRGCIGLCSALQGPRPDGNYQPFPEEFPGTECFLTEAEASAACRKNCKKPKRPFVFSKQSEWKGGKPPKPGPDGQVPPDSLDNRGGYYNYVSRYRSPKGKKYCWMNHSTGTPGQTATFNDTPCDDRNYPDKIWCCSCKCP